MDKPPYEVTHLRAAMLQCDINIAALQKGIDDEIVHKAELQGHIDAHTEYLKWCRENPDGNNI